MDDRAIERRGQQADGLRVSGPIHVFPHSMGRGRHATPDRGRVHLVGYVPDLRDSGGFTCAHTIGGIWCRPPIRPTRQRAHNLRGVVVNMSKLQRMTIVLVLLLFGLQPLDGGGRIGTQAAHAAPETDARVAGREPSQSTSSASTYVPEALGGTASTGGLIIDDLDPWTVWPCLIAPCPGTGFSLGGPTGGWQESSGSTANMYDGHAYFTYAAALSEWGGEETNNWAQWVLEEPLIGVYHVDAFIPHVSTGRDDTQSAQYRIYHAGGVSVVAVDQTRNPGWVRLGTFEFDDAIQSLPRVTLRDATPDYSSGGQRKTVLFDAIRWTEGDVAEPPSSGATADSYLRNASRSMILPDGTRCKRSAG